MTVSPQERGFISDGPDPAETPVDAADYPESQESNVANNRPDHLANTLKGDSFIVKVQNGGGNYTAQMEPVVPNRGDVPLVRVTPLDIDEISSDHYIHGTGVTAYLRDETEGKVWKAVEEGVVIAPVITLEGVKLAMFGEQPLPPKPEPETTSE